ncbi:hypothetical protein LIER_41332 [Lithospermum erythrorhizon]|uniref:DUF4371 domain-containing protein n=1 Tax=Lithospermum erythrorhizon TaxID=34254 RepID=A0AAV3R975_LITER
MTVVLRYVNEGGFIQERLLDLIHVRNTTAETLKGAIFFLLNEHGLSVHNIHGQGYDGASNMSAAREVGTVHDFFENKLPLIINCVGSSCKRIQELKHDQANEIAMLVAHDDLETGKGLNQSQCLQRACDTRWGSHYNSVSSLLKPFSPTCTVLEHIHDGRGTASQRGDAERAYKTLTSFEFVFILHMMKEILEISLDLCTLLQRKSQDILNAMDLLKSTKVQIQLLRDVGWEQFIEKRQEMTNPMTMEHHYHFDLFTETTNELLVFCVALDPRDVYKMFNVESICSLVETFYSEDFTDNEKDILKIQVKGRRIPL